MRSLRKRVNPNATLVAAVLVEAFIGLGQEPPTAIQRIIFAATMTTRLVLHASAALVELLVRELDHMEQG